MAKAQVISILCVLVFVGFSSAHIRLETPTPRSQETGIKGPYPCGNFPFFGTGQAITTIKPGPYTIRWGEAINHIGAPFRIALSPANDTLYDQYILYDHIPHNDQWGSQYSMDKPKPYELDIVIPDIDCPKCSLQMLEIMTDKLPQQKGTCCTYPNPPKGKEIATGTILCFSVYHTCANVIITGKTPVDQYVHKYVGPCGPYGMKQATQWTELSNGDWHLVNPNYIPNINNTCPGWDRNACTF